MISGTSKIWSKSGPGDLLIITKMLQKIQEKLWNHLGKYYCCQSGTSKIRQFSESVCPGYQIFFVFFDIFRFRFGISCVFWVYILKIFLRRWGIENDTFSIIKQHPTWIWISYLSKTWTGDHPKLSYFQGWYLNFYFQER